MILRWKRFSDLSIGGAEAIGTRCAWRNHFRRTRLLLPFREQVSTNPEDTVCIRHTHVHGAEAKTDDLTSCGKTHPASQAGFRAERPGFEYVRHGALSV